MAFVSVCEWTLNEINTLFPVGIRIAKVELIFDVCHQSVVVDQGFPRGGTNPKDEQPIIWLNLTENMTGGWGAPNFYHVDPPVVSQNGS